MQLNTSALTQNYERLVIAELQRAGSGFRYDPKKAQMFMHVSTSRGLQITGMNTGVRLLGSVSEFENMDQVTVELSLKKAGGQVVWDGQIKGDAAYLTGAKAPKCLRVLFDLYGSNEAGEESCYQ